MENSKREAEVPAFAAGLGLAAASREKADAYLDEQIELSRKQSTIADLQIEDLKREDKLRHWSLIVHHFSDVLKLLFELAVAAILMTLVALIASAVWSAAHEDGLVIEAFKVPPDMAQKGLTGDVVASELLDRLTDMQLQTDSSRAASTYSSNWGSDIKVEIPDTGISIGEAYRYLAAWLGHQTRISGEIYRNNAGIVLVARVSGHPGVQITGREADLNRLMKKAAENVYRQTQPFRYAIYLFTQIGPGQAPTVAIDMLGELSLNGPASEKPWAYTVWAMMAADSPTMLSRAHQALALDPDLPLAANDLCIAEAIAGHDEQELATARMTQAAAEGSGARQVTPVSDRAMDLEAKAAADEEMGDYMTAVGAYDSLIAAHDFEGSHWAAVYMKSADLAFAHDERASRRVLGDKSDSTMFASMLNAYGWPLNKIALPQYQQYTEARRWRDALTSLRATLDRPLMRYPQLQATVRNQIRPLLPFAEAEAGDAKAARRDIGASSLDCYLCLRVRAAADIASRNWRGAEYWFARAVAQAPSIPFAYNEWGQMLLAKGDLDGAVAKFKTANAKGPHFADPLEMWGEALIAKNRSDLALAKFADAEKYAPNWGRLHLKWGEAFFYAGQKDDAKKQFAIARTLDLLPAEKAALAKLTGNST